MLDTLDLTEFKARITIDYDDLPPCARLWPEGYVKGIVDGIVRELVARSAARKADEVAERLLYGD